MIVYLTHRTSKTAHTNRDCRYITGRANLVEVETAPHPYWPREWVEVPDLVIVGTVRVRDLFLCKVCRP